MTTALKIDRLVDNIHNTSITYPDATFSEKGKVYTCLNPYSYHILRHNPEVYRRMDGIFVDGMLMCKFIRLLWHHNIPRRSLDMSGMAPDLFRRLNAKDCHESLYLLGARQNEVESSAAQIKSAYPDINIIGCRNGYFKDTEERRLTIENIVSLNPDFILIGMGSPLQEKFAADLRDAGFKGIGFTCGGFLHQTSAHINYYPGWIDRYNLRAFYRIYREKGLMGRLYNVLIQFPALFTFDTLRHRLFHRNKRL